ncbi:phospholipid carrier-dependent glycosyltransferase [Patescibacteria group bacterium]
MTQRNKLILILLTFVAVGAFFRLWYLEPGLHFAADEVRDLTLIQESWESGSIPLLGPELRGTGLHYGPFFYHLLTLPYVVTDFSPVAGALVVAIIAILTILLVYAVGKMYFSPLAGLIAAGLYSIAPLVIHHSRWAWNPNPLPFFVLLVLIGIGILRRTQNAFIQRLSILLIAISLGISIQLHLSALVLFALVVVAWPLFKLPRPKWSDILLGIGVIVILLLPLALFEMTEGGNIAKTETLTEVYGDTSLFERLFSDVPVMWFGAFGDLVIPGLPVIISAALFIMLVGLFLFLKVAPKDEKNKPLKIFFISWLIILFVGLTFSEVLVRYYFIGFFPWPFLVLGAVIASMKKHFRPFLIVLIITVFVLFAGIRLGTYFTNIKQGGADEYLVTQETMHKVTDYILSASNGRPYTLEVIRRYEYGSAYEFFLHKTENHPSIDANQTFMVMQPIDIDFEFSDEATNYQQIDERIFGNTRVIHLEKTL